MMYYYQFVHRGFKSKEHLTSERYFSRLIGKYPNAKRKESKDHKIIMLPLYESAHDKE